MKKVQIIQGTTVKGIVVNAGEVHDLSDTDARILILQHQAVLYVPPAAPKAPEVTGSPDYEKLSMKELLKLAEDKGIAVPSYAKKGEIVELLGSKV